MTTATLPFERKRAYSGHYLGKPSGTVSKPNLEALKRQYNARLGIVRGLEALVDNDRLPRPERERKAEELTTQARLLTDTLRRLSEAGHSPSTCEVMNGFTNNTNIASMQGANR
jgi:hypothetical protein